MQNLKKKFKREDLKVGINMNFDSLDEENILILNILAKYEYPLGEELLELLRASFAFHFEIEDLKNVISRENDDIQIPDGLALNLMAISLSTARGLIAAKTKGYFINKYYFPIINVKELAKKLNNKEADE